MACPGVLQSGHVDLSSFTKIPPEIIAKIFTLSVGTVTIPSTSHENNLPWTLFCVCRKWRDLALEMPELWATVEFDSDSDPGLPGSDLIKTTHEILRRAENTLLDFSLLENSVGSDQSISFDLIVPRAHRFQSLSLSIFYEALLQFLNTPPISFSNLEFLYLTSSDNDFHDFGVAQIFRNSPRLRSVKIELEFDWTSSFLSLPWAQLTELSLIQTFELSPALAYGILCQCSSLVFLDINLSTHSPGAGIPSAPISLPFLTSLILEPAWPEEVVGFLNMLILPRLSHFEILDSFCFSTNWDYAGTIAAISHSGAIDRLRIDLYIPPNYEMDVLFQIFPSLTDISLPQSTHLSRSTLDALACGAVLPKLRHILCAATRRSLKFLLDMIHRRVEHGYKTRAQLVCDAKMLAETFNSNGEEAQLIKELRWKGLLMFGPRLDTFGHTQF